MNAATFAAVFAALYVAHHVGDHWVQTHRQALAKGAPDREGRIACARHVLGLVATKLIALGAVVLTTGADLSLVAIVIGLTVDAVSHYWADRRVTLARLAERVGKGDFYRLGAPRPGRDDAPHLGTGAYALDQSWHVGWLFVAALIVAGGA